MEDLKIDDSFDECVSPRVDSQNSEKPHMTFIDPYEIPCIKQEESELSSIGYIKVIVNNLEALNFSIEVLPLGWVVRRSVFDILWLRKILATVYIGLYIPPPFPKQLEVKKHTQISVKESQTIEIFLNSAANHPVISRSQLLIGFLKANDEEKYRIFREQAKKIKSPLAVHECASVTGRAFCDPNDNPSYDKKLSDYTKQSYRINTSLKKKTEELKKHLRNVSTCLQEMRDELNELWNLHDLFPESRTNMIYISAYKEILTSWNSAELEKIERVTNYLDLQFEYSAYESRPFIDLLDNKKQQYKIYKAFNKTLTLKKKKYWEQGNIDRWELEPHQPCHDHAELKNDKELAFTKMCYTETNQVTTLKDMFAYKNSLMRSNLKWYFANLNSRNLTNLRELFLLEIEQRRREHTLLETTLGQLQGGIRTY